MNRFAISTVMILALSTGALAHDTWLLARARAVEPGTVVTLDLTSGMGFPTLDYVIAPERISSAGVRLAGGRTDIGRRRRGKGSLELSAKLASPGIATLWVELLPKSLVLEPGKVLEYLDEIGASDDLRHEWDAMKAAKRPWRETYTKHAKTFVRVGTAEGDRSWSEPVGMRLELLPESDPTSLRSGDTFAVRVLREGKPFGGFVVGAVRAGETHGAMATTDADGRASIVLDGPGLWLLRGTDLRHGAGGDWESDFATLTLDVGAK